MSFPMIACVAVVWFIIGNPDMGVNMTDGITIGLLCVCAVFVQYTMLDAGFDGIVWKFIAKGLFWMFIAMGLLGMVTMLFGTGIFIVGIFWLITCWMIGIQACCCTVYFRARGLQDSCLVTFPSTVFPRQPKWVCFLYLTLFSKNDQRNNIILRQSGLFHSP